MSLDDAAPPPPNCAVHLARLLRAVRQAKFIDVPPRKTENGRHQRQGGQHGNQNGDYGARADGAHRIQVHQEHAQKRNNDRHASEEDRAAGGV